MTSIFAMMFLPFTALVAFFESTRVPLDVICVCCTKPQFAFFTACGSYGVAGFNEVGKCLAGRRYTIAESVSGRFWWHRGTSLRRFYP